MSICGDFMESYVIEFWYRCVRLCTQEKIYILFLYAI